MKFLIIVFLAMLTFPALAQDHPFSRDFVKGVIIQKNSSRKPGFIKWFPAQEEKLIFRENEKAPKEKYSPEELSGFQVTV